MFRNCEYLLHYQATGLPLLVYNHNLDKILRCDEKCDPDRLLPQPFPLFQEERAHINSQMNSTIVTYSQCLTAVGIISPLVEEPSSLNLTGKHGRGKPPLQANLTTATWSNSSDIKWSTCASLKTFVRWQKSFCAAESVILLFSGTAQLPWTVAWVRKGQRWCWQGTLPGVNFEQLLYLDSS